MSETECGPYNPLVTHLRLSKILNMETYDYLTLILLLPLAITTYFGLNYFTTIPALYLPLFLFIYISFAFLVTTPSQYMSSFGIILELVGITIFGILHDFKDLRTSIFIILLTFGTFVSWTFVIYILLAVRGVKQDDMGYLGEMANGVGLISKGVGNIFCGHGEAQACASYHLLPISDMSNNKCNKPLRDGQLGDVGPPPYHFSSDVN